MNQTNFWNDAAKSGAIIGGIWAACSLLGDATQLGGFGIVGFALYIYMLIRCTRLRATALSTPDEEYGYGKRLGFIVATALFVGIINAAYAILASRILFAAKYSAAYEQAFATLAKSGLYSGEMIAQMSRMVQSPAIITLSSIFGQLFLGLLFGLVIAAIAQPREQFGDRPTNDTQE